MTTRNARSLLIEKLREIGTDGLCAVSMAKTVMCHCEGERLLKCNSSHFVYCVPTKDNKDNTFTPITSGEKLPTNLKMPA